MVDVENTSPDDLEFVFRLFDHSVEYQEKHGYPAWRNYDKNTLTTDVKAKNQYKIVIDSQTALVFSVRYSDKVIWRELEKGDSLYIHRMVVNPLFRGKRLFGEVLEWALAHGKAMGLRVVRMDTWAENPKIIDYYKSFGFGFVGNSTTPDTEELPVHNRNLALALLEIRI